MTPSQLLVLKTEITTDPMGLGYAPLVSAGDDAGVAALLNDRTRGFTRVVSPTMVNARGLLARLGASVGASVLDKLDAAKASSPAIRWAFAFIVSAEGIDVGHAETRAMLDQLASAGVLTAAEADAIKTLAVVQASRAEVLFGQPVSDRDVSIALRG